MISTITENQAEKLTNNLRVAWLLPTIHGGSYWHPLFSEFTKIFPQTTIYTGRWDGFAAGFENSFNIELVGKTKFFIITPSEESYPRGFMYVSPAIIGKLLRFKPKVVFVNGFSGWTMLALLLKPLMKWRLIIAYEGSSPNVDYRNSPTHLFWRRKIVEFTDAFITNSQAGKKYLSEILGAKQDKIFARPYEVPTSKAMLKLEKNNELNQQNLQQPIFLFVGQLIRRKGLHRLLEACAILRQQGYTNYTLIVIGQGSERERLERLTQKYELEQTVKWVGWVDYSRIGDYFQLADVFILPTLEDTWGMVVLEAMLFGKPILCSKWAGAVEMIIPEENGYIFDPHAPEETAKLMRCLIDNPHLITSMGQKSQELIASHTSQTAAEYIAQVTSYVLKQIKT
ncbi:glycosyltransferase family 4 protein [Iningainema tapete]|uniref:Glycosyltransferase family 4 protein n=1 Tax=Iningainema tapete BLCC-T55 TaxID=2748662 RepID=A0A8J7CH95_9CYAN|nr:glycosyltransferase family 4 protein [Iningainema tapete]MBD2777375.1 glycosyltransferase family 4 protein [Iningainema tapete BLCC-T55]